MDGFVLRAADVEGKIVRLDVQIRSGAIHFFSGAQDLGGFVRGDLSKWLDCPSGQLCDRHIRWNSVADEIVLNIDVIFVSQVVVRQDFEELKVYISSVVDGPSDEDIGLAAPDASGREGCMIDTWISAPSSGE